MVHNRLNPADIPVEALSELQNVLCRPGRAALVDEGGNRVDLPTPLFRHLLRVVRLMAERRTVVMIPEDEVFTTQAAANYLGVSRQHLVDLLEREQIPHHKVGTHRRVAFRDLMIYERLRDADRKKALDDLMDAVDKAGLYDSTQSGEDE